MKSSYGTNLHISLFGESHGAAIGAVLDGLASGIPLNMEYIRHKLVQRQGASALSTARREPDAFEIISGYFNGFTTGTPLTILIYNQDIKSGDYEELRHLMRPSHADYTAQCKYNGYSDYRGGGHFSGRITAAVVAVGAICLQILEKRNIHIGTHIARCAQVKDAPLPYDEVQLKALFSHFNQSDFPVIDESAGAGMKERILKAKEKQDSVGGILETGVIGMPAGIGEPWFHSIESVLSHLLFSIPAVKGVEFGGGFALVDAYGSEANDAFYYDTAGNVRTSSNYSGGIQGGITNGMPIVIRTAIKPTPSIAQEQQTIDIEKKQNVCLAVSGRHDPAIIHRARTVVDSVVAFGLLDHLTARYGTDWMRDTSVTKEEI